VQVEDHPIDYADFEGVIPAGQYGGGTVMVWDRGTWTTDEDALRGLEKGSLRFRLDGEKLNGSWSIVRIGGRAARGDKNWLLIKRTDAEARSEDEYDVARERPESVVTGRDLVSIADGNGATWNSKRGARRRASPARGAASMRANGSRKRAL